jgi:hypothetical protein
VPEESRNIQIDIISMLEIVIISPIKVTSQFFHKPQIISQATIEFEERRT